MGFSAYGLDLRGHGLSKGPRGDYASKELLIDDLRSTLDFVKSKHEKIVLIGHSLGVITSVIAANEFVGQVDGLILLSAARAVREGAYAKRALTTTLKILVWSIVKPSKAVIHYYREGIMGIGDPHFNFYYTLRFLKVLSLKNFKFPDNITYPVFVGVGEIDELFSEDDSRKLFDEVPAKIKEFAVLPGAKHAYFEDNSFDPLFDWVDNTFEK